MYDVKKKKEKKKELYIAKQDVNNEPNHVSVFQNNLLISARVRKTRSRAT
jgi:hypothetical protein